MKMQTFLSSFRACWVFAAALLIALLTGCGRTVEWEEEVPLNTGETIWIKRSMPWELKGGFGNPFDIARRPTHEQTIQFTYRRKEYIYVGRADITWIAISPITKEPVLIAPAASFGWDSLNNFSCTLPHYVQLTPDISGSSWTWPENIDPWLYNFSANVMANIPSLNETRSGRYSSSDRDQRDATYRLQFPAAARIDPLYKERGCMRKFERLTRPEIVAK